MAEEEQNIQHKPTTKKQYDYDIVAQQIDNLFKKHEEIPNETIEHITEDPIENTTNHQQIEIEQIEPTEKPEEPIPEIA